MFGICNMSGKLTVAAVKGYNKAAPVEIDEDWSSGFGSRTIYMGPDGSASNP